MNAKEVKLALLEPAIIAAVEKECIRTARAVLKACLAEISATPLPDDKAAQKLAKALLKDITVRIKASVQPA